MLHGCVALAQAPLVLGEGDVALPGPEGMTLRAHLVPAIGGAPGTPVLAFHGCGGLGRPDRPIRLPPRERDWAQRLAALGHPVLFVDSFGSRGRREACEAGSAGVEPESVRRADAHAAAVWAMAQPWATPGGVVLLGWSHGGTTVTAAAAAPLPAGAIRGVVAFYPGCFRLLRGGGWTAAVPMLMLLGEADEWTAARNCQRLALGTAVRVVTYEGAHHGFDAPSQPLTERSGLANTARGGGIATVGTDPVARDDARRIVPDFIAGLRPANR